MRGNTASTRARLGLHGYSSQCLYDPENPDTCPIDSAWFDMAYEESKGLGEEYDRKSKDQQSRDEGILVKNAGDQWAQQCQQERNKQTFFVFKEPDHPGQKKQPAPGSGQGSVSRGRID